MESRWIVMGIARIFRAETVSRRNDPVPEMSFKVIKDEFTVIVDARNPSQTESTRLKRFHYVPLRG